jgi:hypothetical protein
VEAVEKQFKNTHSYNRNEKKYDIDSIELDQNLQHILKGKNYRVVHDDFLTYNSYKKYDVNYESTFSNGDKHLLKAIEMQQQGGKIVCLLNAETLKNPYSNIRKELINQLEKYNAKVEFIQDAFSNAERKTNVETALIYIDIPKMEYNSTIINELKKEEYNSTKQYNSTI